MDPPRPPPPSDITTLQQLDDEAIVQLLQARYEAGQHYTRAGPSHLIAVNPFAPESLPATAVQYRDAKNVSDLPPHAFGLAETAYRNMTREQRNQSIVLIGESGAGKTENAKLISHYFATRTGGAQSEKIRTLLEHANVILTAFTGVDNGSTNSNHSRLNCLTSLRFTSDHKLCGASIRALLLDDVHVARRSPTERNFHIFYQLLAGCSADAMKELHFCSPSTDDFAFTRFTANPDAPPARAAAPSYTELHAEQSTYFALLPLDVLKLLGSGDAQAFVRTTAALEAVGVTAVERQQVFSILAAILHLGNFEFIADKNTEACSIASPASLKAATTLLGVPEEPFTPAMISPRIKAGREIVRVFLNKERAGEARNALAMQLYVRLFEWIIGRINKAIEAPPDPAHTISILDISGFYAPPRTSVLQLAYNYTNERVLQMVHLLAFVREQERYLMEKLNWTYLDFGVEHPLVALIDKKPIGLIPLLDEESLFPRATDETFAAKVQATHKRAPQMKSSGTGKTFVITHNAGECQYDVQNWLWQNRSPFQEDLQQCMHRSSLAMLAQQFTEDAPIFRMPQRNTEGRCRGASFITRITAYKESLDDVIPQLRDTTTVHTVWCIAPNRERKPSKFNADLVMKQVAQYELLSLARIIRKGYTVNFPYREFITRFGNETPPADAAAEVAEARVIMGDDASKAQFGTSRIFFRLADYEALLAANR